MKSSMSIVLVVAVILATASPAHSLGYQVLHHFEDSPDDGQEPSGSLTLDSGKLYGMTWAGGDSNCGTVFSLDTDGSNFALLRDFAGGDSDGKNPSGDLTLDSTTLYGMTSAGGGVGNCGTVFSMDTNGSNFALLHEFSGGTSDGAHPRGSLILDSPKLYGMTTDGGASGLGTIFSMDTDGNNFAILHDFANGAEPYGSLILDSSKLYGMTYHGGGSDDYGTVFSIDTDGTDFALLHDFVGGGNDGRNPYYGSLTFDSGKLYGMTLYGGDSGLGTIFSMNTDGTGFALLHECADEDGALPYGTLSLGLGKLYGMTAYGGDSSKGTVFSMDIDGSNFSLLHEFAGGSGDGENPYGSPTWKTGRLYGMTSDGGDSDKGTIFVVYTVPGDVNGDGWVDTDDLSIIITYWGQSGLGPQYGDLNANGVVDGPDYTEVLSYWNPPSEPPSETIPEPPTLGLLLLGGLALLRRRRK